MRKFAGTMRTLRSIFKKIVLLLICMLPLLSYSQEQTSKDKSPATSKAQRKKAKQKWKEQRKIEKQSKKAVKEHHKRLQTKETRKKMKRERRKGEKMRGNKREFFLIRWFKFRKK
ncbi:MAG: hypothetical protein M3R27_08005 [Bacteroidota bacterium]|nr:hypothetical protein [Bacteroidota bacterium]